MGNVAKYQHGWNMTFTVVELLMIIPKSTYLSISLPYFSIYHFFSLTLYLKFCGIYLLENNKIKNIIYISFFTSINSYTFVRFLQNVQREKIEKSNR